VAGGTGAATVSDGGTGACLRSCSMDSASTARLGRCVDVVSAPGSQPARWQKLGRGAVQTRMRSSSIAAAAHHREDECKPSRYAFDDGDVSRPAASMLVIQRPPAALRISPAVGRADTVTGAQRRTSRWD
jgi:hypothetical protein